MPIDALSPKVTSPTITGGVSTERQERVEEQIPIETHELPGVLAHDGLHPAPEPELRSGHTDIVGDTQERTTQTRQELGGAVALRLGANTGLLFSNLPANVQQDIKSHINRFNVGDSLSMSPKTLEFVRAEARGTAFDVTFAVRDYTGRLDGERTQLFGAQPPTATPRPIAAAITALDALPVPTRTAIETHLAALNEGESMSMSPKTFTFVSATPLSDGGHLITLHAAELFGGGDDVTQKLSAQGRWS